MFIPRHRKLPMTDSIYTRATCRRLTCQFAAAAALIFATVLAPALAQIDTVAKFIVPFPAGGAV